MDALLSVAEINDPRLLTARLEAGAYVNQVDANDRNALFYVSNPESIPILVNAGINVNKLNNGGQNALFHQVDNPNVIKALLDAGIRPDIIVVNEDHRNILFYVTEPETLKHLISASRTDKRIPKGWDMLNLRDKENRNALFGNGGDRPEIVELLIEAGIDVNSVDSSGENALFGPGINNPAVVRLLLDANINIHRLNYKNQNVLFKVTNIECYRMLLEAGLRDGVNQINHNGNTPLMKQRNPEILSLLLEAGAGQTIDQINLSSHNALLGKDEIGVKLLLDAGIDIHHVDRDGRNIILFADSKARQLLIDAGVDPRNIDNFGRSVLFYEYSPAQIQLLLDAGADEVLEHKDLEGYTALTYIDDVDIAAFLVKVGANFQNYRIPVYSDLNLNKYRNLFNALLENGWNIENFVGYKEIPLMPQLFSLNQVVRNESGSNAFYESLVANGHSRVADRYAGTNLTTDEIRTLLRTKPDGYMGQLAHMCRTNPSIIPVDTVYEVARSTPSIQAPMLLFHHGIYPEITVLVKDSSDDIPEEDKIVNRVGSFKLDTFEKAQTVAFFAYKESQFFSYPHLYLNTYVNLNDREHHTLNSILAPILLEALYLHPVSQQNLSLKRREENTPLQGDAYYFYLYNTLHQMFVRYLTAEEIFKILNVDYLTLYYYRLRRNYLDNRSFIQIMKQDYPGKEVREVIREKYGELYDENSLEFLWTLLFEL